MLLLRYSLPSFTYTRSPLVLSKSLWEKPVWFQSCSVGSSSFWCESCSGRQCFCLYCSRLGFLPHHGLDAEVVAVCGGVGTGASVGPTLRPELLLRRGSPSNMGGPSNASNRRNGSACRALNCMKLLTRPRSMDLALAIQVARSLRYRTMQLTVYCARLLT